MSCLLAPSTITETGMPAASVINDLFVPRFPRSVVFPVASPPSNALVNAPSTLYYVQSKPINSLYSVKAGCQAVVEDAILDPLLKVLMCRASR